MSARCIRIDDLATLLNISVGKIRRLVGKLGLEVEDYRAQPAVNRQLVLGRLDPRTLSRLRKAAQNYGYDVERCTWTVASFPELAGQWHPERNQGVKSSEISFNTTKHFWWQCPAASNHEWHAAPLRRVVKQANGEYRVVGCPFCSQHRTTRDRSLAAKFPKVAREWHPTLNGDLQPSMVGPQSHKNVWWGCSKGHRWQAEIRAKTKAKSPCPYCAGTRATRENSLAVTAPALAAQWHKTRNGTLKPTDITVRDGRAFWWKCPKGADHEWQARPSKRLNSPSCPFCINRLAAKDNCLANKYPAIAKQWHPKKNGTLTPRDVVFGTRKVVWWKCPNGPDHEWRRSVTGRTFVNRGCPFCAGFRVSVTNSLASRFPKVAREWHPLKNTVSSPKEVLGTSTKTGWWKCYRGHEWRAPIHKRTVSHHGCPECEKIDTRRFR